MKRRTVSFLSVALAMAVSIPVAHAQRAGFAAGIAPAAQVPALSTFTMHPFRVPQTIITSPIQPMTNPIQPILPSPYMSFGNARPNIVSQPTVIIVSPQGQHGHHGRDRGNRRGTDVTIIAPNSTVIAPTVVTSPYVQPYNIVAPAVQTNPFYTIPATVQQPVVVQPAPPRQPRPYIAPPPIGTSKSDVILLLGSPIGTVGRPSTETLYFDGGPIVVLQNGQVIQVR
jgi:hypothetical protein